MHLTPAILEAAYEYLRTTPPFKGWKLPDPDALEFWVTNGSMNFGTFRLGYRNGDSAKTIPAIEISARLCPTSKLLIETMAHEMVHLHNAHAAPKSRAPADHGPKFLKLARQVCRHHGFNPETF